MLCCCSEDKNSLVYKEDIGYKGNTETLSQEVLLSHRHKKNHKIVGGIKFQFKTISALNFIERTGQRVYEDEKHEINNESVIIFEISDTNSINNIFEHPKMVFSQDDAVQYLTCQLATDLKIVQGGKTFSPNGVQYEGVMGATSNIIRVITFFKGIDLEKEYTIEYNDQLFDAGLVILKQNVKQLSI